MNREEVLTNISFALARRGEPQTHFGSVASLRRKYPGIPASLRLERIAEVVHTVNLAGWRSRPKPTPRKSLLSAAEMRVLSAGGVSDAEIGRRAGVSRERVAIVLGKRQKRR